MTAYYNEFDPYAAAWLRNLIARGHIAPGDVDERSIADVRPDDLRGYDQHHFFAGVGVWSYALRLAGWPDDRPVWTGSCPCQPFSAAGKRKGTADDRHLWPEFRRIITECAPPVVFGEQVASKDGRAWLAAVRADLEALGYAVGAADLCAAGCGAPHIRQRLWFVARAMPTGRPERRPVAGDRSVTGGGPAGLALADTSGSGLEVVGIEHARAERTPAERGGAAGGVGDALGRERAGDRPGQVHGAEASHPAAQSVGDGAAGAGGLGFWSDIDWLPCRDGKARPTQPGLFPLAHGAPARVGRLRAYGNAIVAPLAAEFIAAAAEAIRLGLRCPE